MKSLVHFRHVVTSVEYDNDADHFTVWIRDLPGNKDNKEIFSHVVVASGAFYVPNSPSFEGICSFPGRNIHSYDFREAREFAEQTVLIVGSSFSASEIAVQLIRFGAKHVIVTYRQHPVNFKGTRSIEERPLLQRIDNNTIHFKDGTSADVDAIILCTGYLYHYPYLKGGLKFDTGVPVCVMPNKMYKGTVYTQGGNNKLLFIGPFESYVSFSLFDVQARWVYKYILGQLPNEPSTREEMMKSVCEWQGRFATLDSIFAKITFQKDMLIMLAKDVGYPTEYVERTFAVVFQCVSDRMENTWTYRSKAYRTVFTDEQSPAPEVRWDESMDDDKLVKQYTD
ncbi:hypothetical protein DPMN_041904 [Dreissena polymorpha]|uniref:Flavin-containing monooxygenase n=2 Tax=Dreissena polymorpha TaxID=45954 RepID=A0A9D4CY00_DREPO|nr:hypothetical protein DPMN_041904 [Dreissena polymorpha]